MIVDDSDKLDLGSTVCYMEILHAIVRASESPPVFAGGKKGDIRLVKLVIVSNINPKVLKHKNNNIQFI